MIGSEKRKTEKLKGQRPTARFIVIGYSLFENEPPEDLFQGHTRFVGPILQTDLSLCSARCLLFADFHFRASQIPAVILDHITGNSNSGDHQQAVPGRKHVSQSSREKMGDRTLQNFLRKGRFRPECGVGVVAMRSYHCRDLHEAESSRSGSNSSRRERNPKSGKAENRKC